jgi:hypothetical protein
MNARKKVVGALIFVLLSTGALVGTMTPLGQPFEDPDNDGLHNAAEVWHGTNASNPDTDGDGLPDGVEVKADEALPGADPLRMDVYVEVDYEANCNFSQSRIEQMKQTFDRAPVRNPNGERGIELHLVFSDEIQSDEVERLIDVYSAQGEHFDHRLSGYHYVFSGSAASTGRNFDALSFVPCGTTSAFMHELGHSLGLRPGKAPGIDSYDVPLDEYPSVMNYARRPNTLNYSAGGNGPRDHDDWGYIGDHVFTPPVTELCEQVGASTHECSRGVSHKPD